MPQQQRAHPRGDGGHLQLSATARGLALLEALIALLVLAAGVLSALWLQHRALQTQRQQLHRSLAMERADDLAERMRLNASQSPSYARTWGATSSPSAADCTAQPCNRNQLAVWDLQQLQRHLSAQLPQGDAAIFPLSGHDGWWGVMVAWHDPDEHYRTDTAWGSPACPSAMSCWRLIFRPQW